MFVFKGFSHPKDPQNGTNEDAWRADDLQNVVVVSDGASSSLFSSSWSNILCQSVIENVPDPMDHFNFPKWLERVREKWINGIDLNNLSWYQKPKMASGAFATLVWATIEQSMETPDDLDDDTPLDTDFFRVYGYALGDACLMHFHNDRLVRSIPVVRSADFDSTPPLMGSVNLGVDLTASFVPIDFVVPEGDWIILATDAMSQWILSQCENGSVPDWRSFWNQTPEQYDDLVERIRQEQQIRIDDSTVVLCCVGSDAFLDREFNVETSTPTIRQEDNRFSFTQEYKPEPPAQPAPSGKTVSVSSVFLDFPDAAPMQPAPPRPIPPVPQPEPEPEPSSAKTGFHQTTEIPPLPTDELGIDSDFGIPNSKLPNSKPKSDSSAFRTPPSAPSRPAAKPTAPRPTPSKPAGSKPTASRPAAPRPAAPKRIQPSQEQRIEPPKPGEEEYKVAQPQPGSEPKMSAYMAELERRKIAEIEQEEQRKREQESKFGYQFQKGMSEGIKDMKEGLSDMLSGPVGEQAKEAVKKGKEKVTKFFGRLFKKGKEDE